MFARYLLSFTGLVKDASVSARALGNWFKEDFPDTAVCPHKTDYCGECFEYKTSIKSIHQKINLHKVCHHSYINKHPTK